MNAREFWDNVIRSDEGCWLWTRALCGGGYGCLSFNGKRKLAHRLAWELVNKRQIPSGMNILHNCDHPSCVNPEHLSVGTQKENVAQAWSRGRARNVTAEHNRTKTHCKNGHEFTPENTCYMRVRKCRACNATRQRNARK